MAGKHPILVATVEVVACLLPGEPADPDDVEIRPRRQRQSRRAAGFATALGRYPERVPDVGRIRCALAKKLTESGHPANGAVQYRLAHDLLAEALGPDHPDTLHSLVGMWMAFFVLRDPEQAWDGLVALLPRLVRVLGPADEQTLAARLTLVAIHHTRGDRTAAVAELAEVAARAEEARIPEVAAAVAGWRGELG